MTTAKKFTYQQDHLQMKVKVDEAGRVLIPAEFRKALGIKQGERLVMRVENGEIRMWTFAEATRRVHELMKPYIVPGRSIADELIAERRREAERE